MRSYQQCTRCILDTNDDADIRFDDKGVCNYCHHFDYLWSTHVLTGEAAKNKIAETVARMKESSKGGQYDCLLGLSGGVDSSYLAYLAKELGLNPLCVHFDNGWNSEQAVNNIQNIVNKQGFDLYTYVINWDEFRDLQRAYIAASVIDIEAITDHAIFASMYKLALERNIKFVLSGFNIATEGVMVEKWTHRKTDYINIRDIHAKYGTKPLKTFPLIDFKIKKQMRKQVFEVVELLNWIDYDKQKAKQILKEQFDWRDYGGKHYESIWTRFYQGYILPNKFKVDKRRVHLSSLICAGQITREQAFKELQQPIYDPAQLAIDKEFVLKKLGYTEAEFDAIMKEPARNHSDFKVEGSLFYYYPVLSPLRPLWESYKKIRGK